METIAQSCVLYFQGGTSDKEYRLSLEASGNAWLVNAMYGRREGNLKPAAKTAAPVDYPTALRVYQKVRKEKLGEGYREVAMQQTAPPTADLIPAAAQFARVEVELLTPIEMSEIGQYIVSDRYGFQEKVDGDRSPVRREDNSFIRYNRKGQPKPLVSEVAAALSQSAVKAFLLDGEIEGTEYWGFSALEFKGGDLRPLPFRERHRIATEIFAGIGQPCALRASIRLLPVITGAAGKEAFVKRLIAENAEGVAVCDLDAPHKPGRAGQHFKLKFVVDGHIVRVLRHNIEGKRSVDVELLNSSGVWVPYSSVSIPAKYGPLPAPGTLLEVRYLYAHRGEQRGELGGSFNQAVYLRRRDDLDDSAATVAQLKFKRGE